VTVHEIAVTGIGLITPAGVGAQDTWQGTLTGRSAAAYDSHLAENGAIPISCRVPGFDPVKALGGAARRMERFVQLALAAAREAITDAALDTTAWEPARVAVIIGVGAESKNIGAETFRKCHERQYRAVSPTAVPRIIVNAAAYTVSQILGAQGPSMAVSTACASGADALAIARDLLAADRCDIAIAGGTEAPVDPITAVSFRQMQALSQRTSNPEGASRPFDTDRDGFVLGEGAGLLVLERAAHARARRAPIRALLTGHGQSNDAYHYAAGHPDGRGITQAYTAALTDADLATCDIDHINAHATSTVMNDAIEATTLNRIFEGRVPPVTATKSIIGHTLGAAGAIEAGVAVLALQHQLIPPTANLDTLDTAIDLDIVTKAPRKKRLTTIASNSFGFGGHNTVLIIKTP
jgi:3-oxoacyl-[acyl-carrier-protein] synthase II